MSDNPKPSAPALKTFQPITKVKTLQDLFDHPGLKDRMEHLLPRHLNADRMLRTMMNAVLKTPGLAKASPLSMLGAAMTIGYLGLEPNTPLQLIHLIPFDVNKWDPKTKTRQYIRTDIQAIVGYQGYLELISRGGKVQGVPTCKMIWPGDVWHHEEGSHFDFKHVEKHAPRREGQLPEYAYMYTKLLDGGEYAEVMTLADVLTIRNRSQGYQAAIKAKEQGEKAAKPYVPASYTEAPWIKHPLPMIRKTPLRQGQKWLPKSAELSVAIGLDEASDDGRVRFDQVLEAEAVSEGAWEVPTSDYLDDEDPEQQEEQRTRTQVQVQVQVTGTVNKDASQQNPTQGTERQQTSATAATAANDQTKAPTERKRAATRKQAAANAPDEPPEDRWGGEPDLGHSGAGGPSEGGHEGQTPPAAAGTGNAAPTTFLEQWLLDEHGEPVGEEPIADPLAYAQLLESAWQANANREALLQQNADGMEEASRADATAAAIIASLKEPAPAQTAQEVEPEAETAAEPQPVPLQIDRGKPNAGQYLKDFKGALATVDPFEADYLDFIAANTPNMMQVPLSTRSLCLKALVEWARARNMEPPASLAATLNQQPAANAPSAADAQLARDRQAVIDRVAEFDACRSSAELVTMQSGIVIRRFAERLRAEGKQELLDQLNEGYMRNEARFKGPPA